MEVTMHLEINNYIQQNASISIYLANIGTVWVLLKLFSLFKSLGTMRTEDKAKSLIYKILKTITRHYFK